MKSFSEFALAYGERYRRNDAPWMGDFINDMIARGICDYEVASNLYQELSRSMWLELGMADRQFYRSKRDYLMYVLEDWKRLERTGENILELFS